MLLSKLTVHLVHGEDQMVFYKHLLAVRIQRSDVPILTDT
jgi:hypothetical protein